jgi:glucokinase
VTVSTAQAHGRPRGAQSARVYIVVNLGGTRTRTAVFDSSGQMLTRRAIATPRTGGPAGVIAAILDQIREAVAQAPRDGGGCRRERPRDRRIPHRPHPQRAHPGFNNIPLGPRLHDALQLPVEVHNDANAATIAEQLRASCANGRTRR